MSEFCNELAPDGINRCRELKEHDGHHWDHDRVRWFDKAPKRLDQNQVGGDHYKKRAFTPWEIIDEYGLDFYAGNALKYLLRSKDKGGLEDLKKARHYLEKLIELREKKDEGNQQP